MKLQYLHGTTTPLLWYQQAEKILKTSTNPHARFFYWILYTHLSNPQLACKASMQQLELENAALNPKRCVRYQEVEDRIEGVTI